MVLTSSNTLEVKRIFIDLYLKYEMAYCFFYENIVWEKLSCACLKMVETAAKENKSGDKSKIVSLGLVI